MKQKRSIAIFIAFLLFFEMINLNVNAAKFVLPKNAIVVSNYSQFYKQIKSAISTKKTSLILYVKKFNSIYDIEKSINQSEYELFNQNYVVSSWKYKYVNNNKDRLMYINFVYTSIDGLAKNYNELVDIIKKKAIKKQENIKVKVFSSNTEIESKKLQVIDEINKELLDENKINKFEINVSRLSNSKIKVFNYKLTYNNENTVTTSNVNTINSNVLDSTSLKNDDEIYKELKKSILNCDETIKLKISKGYLNNDTKAIMNKIYDMVNSVVQEDVDLGYIKSISMESSYDNTSQVYITVKFNYVSSREAILNQINEANKKAQEIIESIIKPDMTDFEKELSIHNYIINNTRYDEENYYNGSIPRESFTSYGALVKGVAVCQGYASAMSKLLNLAGIENMIIIGQSKGEQHAWNLVKLNGQWYHVDATWDDPIAYINGVKKDIIRYDYFNLTDVQISKDHDWDKDKYPKCTATEYRYSGN